MVLARLRDEDGVHTLAALASLREMGDGGATLIIRSSPRIIAPDWRHRCIGTRGVIRLVLLLTLLFLVLRAVRFRGFLPALVLCLILGGAVVRA